MEKAVTAIVHDEDRMLADADLKEIPARYFYRKNITARKDIREIVIHEGVYKVDEQAFFDCDDLKILVLPDSLKDIPEKTFKDMSGFTILCSPNSYAHDFAQRHEIPFVLLNSEVEGEYDEDALP